MKVKKKPQGMLISTLIAGDAEYLKIILARPSTPPETAKQLLDERDRFAATYARQVIEQSIINRKNGSALKDPETTKIELEKYRDKFIHDHGFKRGWMTAAACDFKLSANTIRKRLKENK